jgi:Phytanoyl-CoA dioxygenase (PhyH)
MRIRSLIPRRVPVVRDTPSPQAAPQQPADAVREEILAHGLDAGRAMALADALEREGRLLEALDMLVVGNRLHRDAATERRLVRLRRAAFAQLDHSLAPSTWPHFAVDDAPLPTEGPMEVAASALTPAVLRAGILRHGHLLVRGLVSRARVARLRDGIDQAFRAQELISGLGITPETAPWYDELEGIPDGEAHRLMVRASHGLLAADSPRALFDFLETVRDVGLGDMIAAYLGERPALSAMKCTLRRADARDWRIRLSNWHQDGSFLGHGIRTLSAWFALSRCGRDAPGMDLIPRRLQRLLTRGESGTQFDWTVASDTIARELPGVPIWRPEFEPGDVLLFDHWSLHRTAADEEMPRIRYAIESWFFAPSVYPGDPGTILVA